MNRNSIPLNALVKMWPTPSICGNYNRKGASATSGDGLDTAVRNWPTPAYEEGKKMGRGQLNPDWVCWLMGWPIGWESLELY